MLSENASTGFRDSVLGVFSDFELGDAGFNHLAGLGHRFDSVEIETWFTVLRIS